MRKTRVENIAVPVSRAAELAVLDAFKDGKEATAKRVSEAVRLTILAYDAQFRQDDAKLAKMRD